MEFDKVAFPRPERKASQVGVLFFLYQGGVLGECLGETTAMPAYIRFSDEIYLILITRAYCSRREWLQIVGLLLSGVMSIFQGRPVKSPTQITFARNA